ncbi:hypothetical protein J6590_033461 [Homalodisca vitripennis]|nr:hypothetical protein J6590_033461 [Homalodisca vitripennis]
MFSFFRQKWGDTKGATEARTDGHGHFQSVLFQPQIMCQIVQLDLTPEKHQLEMSMNINALECSECSRCHWSSDKRRKTSPGPQRPEAAAFNLSTPSEHRLPVSCFSTTTPYAAIPQEMLTLIPLGTLHNLINTFLALDHIRDRPTFRRQIKLDDLLNYLRSGKYQLELPLAISPALMARGISDQYFPDLRSWPRSYLISDESSLPIGTRTNTCCQSSVDPALLPKKTSLERISKLKLRSHERSR